MANVNPNNTDQAQDSPKSVAEIATSFSFAPSEIITVNVGPEKVAYDLDRGILVSKCPFFEKCLRSGMREEQEKTVNLAEELPEAFDTLVQWMYTGKIVVEPRRHILFIDAYLLADKFCTHDLQNSIMDALRQHCLKFVILPKALDYVWKRSTENCELRKFCFDQVWSNFSQLYHFNIDAYDELPAGCPQRLEAGKTLYKIELD
ncbi:hypothetical protein LTS15_004707 [Exophiala xenobiotica]|nr:hypothetical protein LTS15_004707 [Exophiala xenobiotica]